MRTLLLILLMLTVAVAAGLSFVITAGAGGGLSLERDCTPDVLERNVDTLFTCTFTVSNGGSAVAEDVRLSFEASSDGRIPDRYRFFTYRLDGRQMPVDPGQLTYEAGDIAPGRERVLEIGVVIRDSLGFAARTVVTVGPEQRREIEQTFRTDVIDAADHPVYLRVEPQPVATATSMLAIENTGQTAFENVRVEVAAGHLIDVAPTSAWTFDASSGHHVSEPGIPVQFGRMYVAAELSSELDCAWAAPTFVVTGTVDGEPITLALIFDEGVQLDECDAIGGQGGGGDFDPTAFPATGAGAAEASAFPVGVFAAMFVAGGTIVASGVRLRR